MTLAWDILALDQPQFSAAFHKSPLKWTKLRGLKRNTAVVLRNIDTKADVDVLTRPLDDSEPIVREHVDWRSGRLAPPD